MAGQLDLDARIAADFAWAQPRLLGILRFGSSVRPDAVPRDIDLCLVAPGQPPSELLLEVFRRVDVRGKRYDVCVFEALPIWMRHEVLETNVIAWTADVPALTEYLYFMRKPCLDMVMRRRKAV